VSDHTHDHDDHGHDHPHDHGSPAAVMTARVNALIGALETRGVATDADVTTVIERFLAAAGPNNGARIVARAWVDPAYRALLLDDATAAIAALGLDMSHWAPVALRAVENTEQVHNIVVCTLCSCYPIALLGPAPQWYKSEAYRSRVVREPRAVLREFGVVVPDDRDVRVWDSTAELRYLVLPRRPPGTAGWDEDRLAATITRDALVGAAEPIA
jgi:nitrile hydratase